MIIRRPGLSITGLARATSGRHTGCNQDTAQYTKTITVHVSFDQWLAEVSRGHLEQTNNVSVYANALHGSRAGIAMNATQECPPIHKVLGLHFALNPSGSTSSDVTPYTKTI